jgi:hypothetical protein
MKKLIYCFLIFTFFVSCSDNPVQKQPPPKVVPDHTPYIAGLIEASSDTTFHYPEVLVGYFTDTRAGHHPPEGMLARHHYKGLYNLTLFRQVTQTSIAFALSWQPESNAVVKVRGPLGTSKEKEVKFSSEGNGVYGDKGYSLARIPDEKYKLLVTLPDGRTYTAKTHIPEATTLNLPDSISIKVTYFHEGNGAPHEKEVKRYLLNFQDPANSFMRILQYNSSVDRKLLLLKPNEHFWYRDHGNYLRQGIGYNIVYTSSELDTLTRPWAQKLSKPKDEIWNKEHWWYRASFFSKGIGKMFYQLFNVITTKNRFSKQMLEPKLNAARDRDSTFLFRISTIRKLGKDGNMLPKDAGDAIGFFVGEFSLYEQTTLYPNRQFNLDSVWNAWHDRNK